MDEEEKNDLIEELKRIKQKRAMYTKKYQDTHREKVTKYAKDYYDRHKGDDEWLKHYKEVRKKYRDKKKEEKKV